MKETDQNKSNKMQVQKLPTGIEGFDDVCRGGLPTSRSTLVSGTSGTGKTVLPVPEVPLTRVLQEQVKQYFPCNIFIMG